MPGVPLEPGMESVAPASASGSTWLVLLDGDDGRTATVRTAVGSDCVSEN